MTDQKVHTCPECGHKYSTSIDGGYVDGGEQFEDNRYRAVVAQSATADDTLVERLEQAVREYSYASSLVLVMTRECFNAIVGDYCSDYLLERCRELVWRARKGCMLPLTGGWVDVFFIEPDEFPNIIITHTYFEYPDNNIIVTSQAQAIRWGAVHEPNP